MCLFKKKFCAICGNKVKGLLPASFGDAYVCGTCLGVVDIEDDIRFKMTIEDFLKYRDFRTENQKLKDIFKIKKSYDFGIFFNKLCVDTVNNMFCLNQDLSSTIFKAEDVDYFTITEDSELLYEGKTTGLNFYESFVPEHARALSPLIQQIRYDEQHRKEDEGYVGTTIDPPFEKFYINIYLKNHPYRSAVKIKYDGPYLSTSNPSISEYIAEYRKKAEEMAELAQVLMGLVEAGAKARGEAFTCEKAEEPAEEKDAVAEIKRYKELFDLGAITEEEFAAKKKQLMDI